MSNDILLIAGKFRQLTGITPKFDGLLSCATGKRVFDIFDLEKKIVQQAKKRYDSNNCVYDGKPNYSLNMVVEAEWGKEALELLKQII